MYAHNRTKRPFVSLRIVLIDLPGVYASYRHHYIAREAVLRIPGCSQRHRECGMRIVKPRLSGAMVYMNPFPRHCGGYLPQPSVLERNERREGVRSPTSGCIVTLLLSFSQRLTKAADSWL